MAVCDLYEAFFIDSKKSSDMLEFLMKKHVENQNRLLSMQMEYSKERPAESIPSKAIWTVTFGNTKRKAFASLSGEQRLFFRFRPKPSAWKDESE